MFIEDDELYWRDQQKESTSHTTAAAQYNTGQTQIINILEFLRPHS